MSAPVNRPTTDAGPLTIFRDLQGKTEALFLENKTLQQEVKRLQAMHPVISIQPTPASLPWRVLLRLLPGLRRRRQLAIVQSSGFFDPEWYLARYSDVRKSGQDPALHFLTTGAREWRDPGPHFNTAHYFRMYPDIAEGGLNPLLHYLQAGWREGRAIRPGMRHGDIKGAL